MRRKVTLSLPLPKKQKDTQYLAFRIPVRPALLARITAPSLKWRQSIQTHCEIAEVTGSCEERRFSFLFLISEVAETNPNQTESLPGSELDSLP